MGMMTEYYHYFFTTLVRNTITIWGGISSVSEKTATFSPYSRRSLLPLVKETPEEWVLTRLRDIRTHNFLGKLFGPVSGAGYHFNAEKISCSMLINEKPSIRMDQSETK